MWIVSAYQWLESNNLWKATVAWSVGLALNSLWAIRAWKRHHKRTRQVQAELLDKLDVNTPGGIADLASLLRSIDTPDDPDDNGNGHGGFHVEGSREGPGGRGGGGSAGHH